MHSMQSTLIHGFYEVMLKSKAADVNEYFMTGRFQTLTKSLNKINKKHKKAKVLVLCSARTM